LKKIISLLLYGKENKINVPDPAGNNTSSSAL